MQRLQIASRANYTQRLEEQGLSFHSWDNYWKEDVCYRFSLQQIEAIEAATEELHQMCIEAMTWLIQHEKLGCLHIPQRFWPAIAKSFRQNEFSLYGRFDLAYDGVSPPKLLEYNADTPTSLLESAVCQWFWLQDQYPQYDQFNSLHEKLIAQWTRLSGSAPVYVASIANNEEDWVCTAYLIDTLVQAGREARRIDIEDIGWDSERKVFVDLAGEPIEHLFKLYPWEWLMRDEFGVHILDSATQFIEPVWKAALSCKGLLPILWQLFPQHPNLLPAYFEPGWLQSYAKKPLYSREGANIQLVAGRQIIARDDGPYENEPCIYQALCLLPEMAGRYPVIGSWVVNGEAAGMCMREDASLLPLI